MNKINYAGLEEITVKSQEELDAIPVDYVGRIFIKFGTHQSPAMVSKMYRGTVAALDSSFVVVWGYSSVCALGNSTVEARDNSSVKAWDNSYVEAYDDSSVDTCDNSFAAAWGNNTVRAHNNSSVMAHYNSIVRACDNSSVMAWDNSFVTACDNSSVVAYHNSSVMAWDNSFVTACDNSSVTPHDNSSVTAAGNSQIRIFLPTDTRIQLSGNSRIVRNPRTIDEYVSFYGIKHDEKTGRFFKAVHRYKDGTLRSDRDADFRYVVGETIRQACDPNVNVECSYGIHISHLNWALAFGYSWGDLAIIEVETDLDKVVVPLAGNGKVRTSEVKVLREVPLEECGVCGKMLARRLGQAQNQRER